MKNSKPERKTIELITDGTTTDKIVAMSVEQLGDFPSNMEIVPYLCTWEQVPSINVITGGNPKYFDEEHEKQVRGAHERQPAGPLQFQHGRKTTLGILRLRTTWRGFKFSNSFARASIDGQHRRPSSPD